MKPKLVLPDDDRMILEQRVASGEPHETERARILLCRANGLSQDQTAQIIGCSAKTVWKWTHRYRKQGLRGLTDFSGRGRKPHQTFPAPEDEDQPVIPLKSNQPSLRTVAEAAGVSMMTVSRALNNYPHIHPDLRQRVLKAVTDLRYRPDPELRKLMVQLRKRKVVRKQGVICSIEADTWMDPTYFQGLIKGAKAQAEALGFIWETFPLKSFLKNPRHSSRVLYHRGVEGILLAPAPMNMYQDFEPLNADWNRFSVVSATIGSSSPMFNRVMPDYFRNMVRTCNTLKTKGCLRVGLLLPADMKQYVQDIWVGAYLSFQLSQGRTPLPPLIYRDFNESMKLQKWLKQINPDALVIGSSTATNKFVASMGSSLPEGITLVAATRMDNSCAGVDELPEQIGAMAAEKLGSMIVHNEKGIPKKPTVTMVEGDWEEAGTTSGKTSGKRRNHTSVHSQAPK